MSISPREQEHMEHSLINLNNEIDNPLEQKRVEDTGNENHNVIDIPQMLIHNDIKLLKKGLAFFPTNNAFHEHELHKNLTECCRQTRLKEYFTNSPSTTPDTATTN